MTYPHAIIIGAALIAAAVFVGTTTRPVEAQRASGPWQMQARSEIAWRIDTRTGEMEVCQVFFASSSLEKPTVAGCSKM